MQRNTLHAIGYRGRKYDVLSVEVFVVAFTARSIRDQVDMGVHVTCSSALGAGPVPVQHALVASHASLAMHVTARFCKIP